MPDEAPAQQDTPDVPASGPEAGTPAETPEVSPAPDNTEKRISDFQAIATRSQQEAAQLRDLVTRAQQGDAEAIQSLGFQLADTDEPEDEYVDPDERIERVERTLAERDAREQQAKQEQEWLDKAWSSVEEQFGSIADGSLDPDEKKYLLGLTDAYGFVTEAGFPDVQKAFEFDNKRLEAKRASWVKTKRSPQAPSGASPSSQPDLDDAEQRREYMAQMASQGL